MNESAPKPSNTDPPPPPRVAAPAARPASPAPPAKRPAPAADDRRDFFGDAMRETLGPLSGIIERKLQPLIAALEAIPMEAERIAQYSLPSMLDQPQSNPQRPAIQPLPVIPQRTLRPPGASAPGQFEQLCSACGKCVEACPAQAIRIDSRGMIADGLPHIVATEQPCVVSTDLACMSACPTGALRMVDRFHLNMGTAAVDHGLCVRDNGEDCKLCVDACPITGEGTSPLGDAIFIHKESGRVRVRKNVCVGCGLCESRCPTSPRAITVSPYRAPVDPIIA